MKLFESNASYAFIPKNACSTLRLSIAIANGCIEGASQIDWIHENNRAFPVTTESAFLVDYSFAILRCPFRRLHSAFFDKVVRDGQPIGYVKRLADLVQVDLPDFTFRKFVEALRNQDRASLNHHWRPQVDFLLYKDYDDLFCMEDFGRFITEIGQKIDLKIVDSRPYLSHQVSRYEPVTMRSASSVPLRNLLEFKRVGKVPGAQSLYCDEIAPQVMALFRDDIDLYVRHFDRSNLLYS